MTQLLQNALYGTALILAVAVLRWVLKGRLIPEARLCLWTVCLFRLLTPAPLPSGLSLWALPARPEPAASLSPPPQSYAPVPSALPAPSSPPQGYPAPPAAVIPAPQPQSAPIGFSWPLLLAATWLAVGLILAVWYALSWRRTRRAVQNTLPVPRPDPRYAPLPSFARLREGVMEGAPLTFGAVRPTVVLSPGLAGEELECVLAHEGVHAARRDNLWHYVTALALIVHWWNPAVWLMARLLRRDVELSCDRAALKKLGVEKRAQYARVLVDLATQGGGPSFSHTFGRKLTEERIVMIVNYKKPTLLCLALSLLLVCSVSVAFATDPPQTAPDPEPAVTEPAENAEFIVDGSAESTVSVCTEEEAEAFFSELQQVIDSLDPETKLALGYKLEYPVAQANCTHPNINQASVYTWEYRDQGNASGHKYYAQSFRTCPDCGSAVPYGDKTLKRTEAHTYTGGTYVGSNHTAVDPRQHYRIYSAQCTVCSYPGQYTVLAGCTPRGCVDINSITPEPDVPERAPDGRYALCEEVTCGVPYDHYHLDGKVVRVYYENPGLLCARSSCTTEGPHTHDGVQFMGKAPEAYVVLHSELEQQLLDQAREQLEDCFREEIEDLFRALDASLPSAAP